LGVGPTLPEEVTVLTLRRAGGVSNGTPEVGISPSESSPAPERKFAGRLAERCLDEESHTKKMQAQHAWGKHHWFGLSNHQRKLVKHVSQSKDAAGLQVFPLAGTVPPALLTTIPLASLGDGGAMAEARARVEAVFSAGDQVSFFVNDDGAPTGEVLIKSTEPLSEEAADMLRQGFWVYDAAAAEPVERGFFVYTDADTTEERIKYRIQGENGIVLKWRMSKDTDEGEPHPGNKAIYSTLDTIIRRKIATGEDIDPEMLIDPEKGGVAEEGDPSAVPALHFIQGWLAAAGPQKYIHNHLPPWVVYEPEGVTGISPPRTSHPGGMNATDIQNMNMGTGVTKAIEGKGGKGGKGKGKGKKGTKGAKGANRSYDRAIAEENALRIRMPKAFRSLFVLAIEEMNDTLGARVEMLSYPYPKYGITDVLDSIESGFAMKEGRRDPSRELLRVNCVMRNGIRGLPHPAAVSCWLFEKAGINYVAAGQFIDKVTKAGAPTEATFGYGVLVEVQSPDQLILATNHSTSGNAAVTIRIWTEADGQHPKVPMRDLYVAEGALSVVPESALQRKRTMTAADESAQMQAKARTKSAEQAMEAGTYADTNKERSARLNEMQLFLDEASFDDREREMAAQIQGIKEAKEAEKVLLRIERAKKEKAEFARAQASPASPGKKKRLELEVTVCTEIEDPVTFTVDLHDVKASNGSDSLPNVQDLVHHVRYELMVLEPDYGIALDQCAVYCGSPVRAPVYVTVELNQGEGKVQEIVVGKDATALTTKLHKLDGVGVRMTPRLATVPKPTHPEWLVASLGDQYEVSPNRKPVVARVMGSTPVTVCWPSDLTVLDRPLPSGLPVIRSSHRCSPSNPKCPPRTPGGTNPLRRRDAGGRLTDCARSCRMPTTRTTPTTPRTSGSGSSELRGASASSLRNTNSSSALGSLAYRSMSRWRRTTGSWSTTRPRATSDTWEEVECQRWEKATQRQEDCLERKYRTAMIKYRMNMKINVNYMNIWQHAEGKGGTIVGATWATQRGTLRKGRAKQMMNLIQKTGAATVLYENEVEERSVGPAPEGQTGHIPVVVVAPHSAAAECSEARTHVRGPLAGSSGAAPPAAPDGMERVGPAQGSHLLQNEPLELSDEICVRQSRRQDKELLIQRDQCTMLGEKRNCETAKGREPLGDGTGSWGHRTGVREHYRHPREHTLGQQWRRSARMGPNSTASPPARGGAQPATDQPTTSETATGREQPPAGCPSLEQQAGLLQVLCMPRGVPGLGVLATEPHPGTSEGQPGGGVLELVQPSAENHRDPEHGGTGNAHPEQVSEGEGHGGRVTMRVTLRGANDEYVPLTSCGAGKPPLGEPTEGGRMGPNLSVTISRRKGGDVKILPKKEGSVKPRQTVRLRSARGKLGGGGARGTVGNAPDRALAGGHPRSMQ
jgi:hypothetical protein